MPSHNSSPVALASVPPIRTFQSNSEAIDHAGDTVNLFRGEVNIPIKLLTLPGTAGLNASVNIMYDSTNVRKGTNTWNREAPTSILGHGWQMSTEKIFIQSPRTGYKGSFKYFYDNGSPNRLYQSSSSLQKDQQGESYLLFELENYQFWDIRYYQDTETWVIIKETGGQSIFGGSDPQFLQKGVIWSYETNSKNPNWIGGSNETSGQEQYVKAWNLQAVKNIWGDQTTFTYQNTEIPIGLNGKTYTRESQVKSLIGVFGRVILFNYETKNDFEYVPAHALPSKPPFVYQDEFEASFLSSIQVFENEQDASKRTFPLQTILFDYQIADYSSIASKSYIPNISFKKRYLCGIRVENTQGDSLPGLVFSYCENDDTGNARGKLQTITYPTGGVVTYSYSRVQLPEVENQVSGLPANGTVRAWFGENNIAIIDYGANKQSLNLRVCDWNGNWDVNSSFGSLTDNHPFNGDFTQLQAVVTDNYVAVGFVDTSGNACLGLFAKKATGFNEWNANVEIMNWSLNGGADIFLEGEEDYLLFAGNNMQPQLFAWDALKKQMTSLTNQILLSEPEASQYAIATQNDFFALAQKRPEDANPSISLFYIERQAGTINTSSSDIVHQFYSQDNFPASFDASNADQFWKLGDFWAIVLSDMNDRSLLLQWDSQFENVQSGNLSPELDSGVNYSIRLSNSAAADQYGNYYRFKGGNGSVENFPDGFSTGELDFETPAQAIYAIGDDIFIASDKQLNFVMVYNPYEGKWVQPGNYTGPSGSGTISPEISDRYFTQGNSVFYRDTDERVYETLLPTSPKQGSLANFAPNYLVYVDGEGSSIVYLINNGQLKGTDEFTGNYYDSGSKGTGTMLAGPSALVSYTGPNLDNAGNLFLYKIVNNSISQNLYDYPVTALSLDSGLEKPLVTSYNYQVKNKAKEGALYPAAQGAFGMVNQFSVVEEIQGSTDPTVFPFGKTRHYFYNNLLIPGLSSTAPNTNLNGMLHKKETFNSEGGIVSVEESGYKVFDFIYPIEAGGNQPVIINEKTSDPPIKGSQQIYGAYVKILSKTSTQNLPALQGAAISGAANIAVTSSNYIDYDAKTGMAVTHYSSFYNSENEERWEKTFLTRSWEVYEGMRDAHIWSPAVQTIQKSGNQQANQATDKIISAHITTWTTWGLEKTVRVPDSKINTSNPWGGANSFVANKAVSLASNAPAWQPGSLPSATDWQVASSVKYRTQKGDVVQFADGDGLNSFTLYSEDGQFPIAAFGNLAYNGGAYMGFESYESHTQWSLNGTNSPWDQLIRKGNSHTGYTSFNLAADASLSRTVALQKSSIGEKFILFAWIKGTEENQSGVFFQLNGKTSQIPLKGINAEWVFFHTVVTPNAGTTVELELTNSGGKDIFVDCIGYAPLAGGVHVNVYDSRHRNVINRLDYAGAIQRNVLNQFHEPIAMVGPVDEVNMLRTSFLSRQFSAEQLPNFMLQINAASGGTYFRFQDGTSLPSGWSAQGKWLPFFNDPGALSSAKVPVGGSLFHPASSTAEQIELTSVSTLTNFGVRLAVFPDNNKGQPINPISLTLGNTTIEYRPGKGWFFNNTLSPGAQKFGKEWIMVVTPNAIFFFADGQQILAKAYTNFKPGNLKVTAQDALYLKSITTFKDPEISITYADGLGREHQHQVLNGTDCLVSGTWFDQLGRKAISVKPAIYENPSPLLLAYQSDYFNYDPTNFTASGKAVQQYNGKNGFSDDEEFPFSQVIFDKSPLSRVVQKGQAGKPFAITSTHPTHVRSRLYGAYDSGDFFGAGTFTSGQYLIDEVSNADGGKSFRLIDKKGQVIAKAVEVEIGKYLVSKNTYNASGQMTTSYSPNYFIDKGDRWVNQYQYDFLGRLIEIQSPDLKGASWKEAGALQMIYDKAGRLRFMQDPRRKALGLVLFKRYDTLGRMTEEGYFPYSGSWNELETKADEQLFPSNNFSWFQQYLYDGSGTATSLFGRVFQTIKSANGNAVSVLKEYTYNTHGEPASVSLKVNEFDDVARVVSRNYDNLGRVTEITYPKGSPVEKVRYSYNDMGQLSQIGTPAEVSKFAAYQYNSIGRAYQTTLDAAGTGQLSETMNYNSKGALLSSASAIGDLTFLGLNLSYNNPPKGGTPYFNGRISAFSVDYPDKNLDLGDGYQYQFEYDQSGRLSVATNSLPNKDFQVDAYDDNGNFQSLARNGSKETFVYGNDNNQITSIAGAEDNKLSYDDNGNVQSLESRKISTINYEPAINRVSAIDFETNSKVSFQYDAGKNRVLKTSSAEHKDSTTKLYIRGLSAYPLHEQMKETGAVHQYVYGPNGIIASLEGNNTYFYLKDHQQSTRVILNQDQQVMAVFDYTVFGALISAAGGSQPNLFDYRYTGQEYESETGLYNYRARFYDAELGRFLGIDPAHQFFSPYVYVGNNPVSFIDPTGRKSKNHWTVGQKIAFGFEEAFEFLADIGLVVAGIAVDVLSAGAAASTLGNVLIGAGVNGAISDVKSAVKFSKGELNQRQAAAEWGISLGVGAVSGLVGGAIGGSFSALTGSASDLASAGINALGGLLSGAATSAAGTLNTFADDKIEGKKFHWSWESLAIGSVAGGLGAGLGSLAGSSQLSPLDDKISGFNDDLDAINESIRSDDFDGLTDDNQDSLIREKGRLENERSNLTRMSSRFTNTGLRGASGNFFEDTSLFRWSTGFKLTFIGGTKVARAIWPKF